MPEPPQVAKARVRVFVLGGEQVFVFGLIHFCPLCLGITWAACPQALDLAHQVEFAERLTKAGIVKLAGRIHPDG